MCVKSGLRSDPTQWTDERQRRGLAGEEQAIRYLLSRGWALVAHRFRVGRAEIDLIVRRGDVVAFVEVKTRRGEAFGSPFAAVTGPKRRELVKVARAWVDRFGRPLRTSTGSTVWGWWMAGWIISRTRSDQAGGKSTFGIYSGHPY